MNKKIDENLYSVLFLDLDDGYFMFREGEHYGLSSYGIRTLPNSWTVEFTEKEIKALDERLGTNYWSFAVPQ